MGPNKLLAAIALSAVAATSTCQAARPPGQSSSVLLGSSAQLADANGVARQQIDQLDLRLGSNARYMTPARIRDAIGEPREPLPTVEIDAPSGIRQSAVSAQIPFGIEGIFWGFRHPSQAWRLVLPVAAS